MFHVRRLAFALAALAGFSAPHAASGQTSPDTLPGYRDVRPSADSAALVQAADDALRGLLSIPVPFVVTHLRRERATAMVSLRPAEVPGTTPVVWHGLAGTVRILADGRRVIVSQE